MLKQIAGERGGELKVVKVNVDEERKLAGLFRISTIPTIVLFRDGKPVAGTVGARNKSQLENAFGLSASGGANSIPEIPGGRGLIARLLGRRAA